MAGEEYPERFCAFIDILGFRQLVARLKTEPSLVAVLREILARVNTPRISGLVDIETLQYRTQSISDAVAISVVPTNEGLVTLFRSLESLATDLLLQGYLIRGAIVRGPLYHDDSTIFGEALVNAYELESTIVRFPRIMVKRDVITGLDYSNKLAGVCTASVQMSEDGPLFLHVLRQMQAEMNESAVGPDSEQPRYQRYYDIQQKLQKRFFEALDTPTHFEKIQWFVKYWNRSLPANGASFRINASGV